MPLKYLSHILVFSLPPMKLGAIDWFYNTAYNWNGTNRWWWLFCVPTNSEWSFPSTSDRAKCMFMNIQLINLSPYSPNEHRCNNCSPCKLYNRQSVVFMFNLHVSSQHKVINCLMNWKWDDYTPQSGQQRTKERYIQEEWPSKHDWSPVLLKVLISSQHMPFPHLCSILWNSMK